MVDGRKAKGSSTGSVAVLWGTASYNESSGAASKRRCNVLDEADIKSSGVKLRTRPQLSLFTPRISSRRRDP